MVRKKICTERAKIRNSEEEGTRTQYTKKKTKREGRERGKGV